MLDGALKEMLLLRAVGVVALTAVGAPGTVGAVTADDAGDAAESPTAFDATPVHLYVAPDVRSVTVTGEIAAVAVRVVPPFEDVQVAV